MAVCTSGSTYVEHLVHEVCHPAPTLLLPRTRARLSMGHVGILLLYTDLRRTLTGTLDGKKKTRSRPPHTCADRRERGTERDICRLASVWTRGRVRFKDRHTESTRILLYIQAYIHKDCPLRSVQKEDTTTSAEHLPRSRDNLGLQLQGPREDSHDRKACGSLPVCLRIYAESLLGELEQIRTRER